MNAQSVDRDLALRFSIFTNIESYKNWESYLNYAQNQTRFSKDITFKWIEAIEILRKLLGEDFIRQINQWHPLMGLISESCDWQVKRQIEYADILEQLFLHDPDYSSFIKKLKAPVTAKQEAMDFLNTASILKNAGFQIRIPEEVINQKNPDMICIDPETSQHIYIEISQMKNSARRASIEHSYKELYKVVKKNLNNPFYSANQLMIPPFGYKGKLAGVLSDLEKQTREFNTWVQYEDTYFSIRLYPLSEERAFNNWLVKENRRKGFLGIPLDFDDTSLISSYKIRDEARQILPDKTGLIVLPVNILHFWLQHSGEAIRSFQYRLKKYPNIIGVYLFSEILNPVADSLRFNTDDRFNRQNLGGGLIKYSLFVRNDEFNNAIDQGTLRRLLNVLE